MPINKVKLILKYTYHPHLVPEEEYCTDPHIRGLMETIPTHWPQSIFRPWKKLPHAEVTQSLVQHDPVKLFGGPYFKAYELHPRMDSGKLFVRHPESGNKVEIGREVALVKTRCGDRSEYIGEYKDPTSDGNEQRGVLVFEDVVAPDGEIITQKETIYNSPHFALIIKSEQPSVATRLLNVRHIFKNDETILQEINRITSRMRQDLVEKQSALDELTQLKIDLERRVEEKTQELTAAHAQILDNEKRKIELLLTGGFAHEIRNALSGLNLELYSLENYGDHQKSACQLILEKLRTLEGSPQSKETIQTAAADIKEALDETGACIDTVYKITDQIRSYAKISKIDAKSIANIDIRKSIADLIEKHQTRLKKANIDVHLESSGNEATIKADPLHVEIIINNLLINAIESIEGNHRADGPGKISIHLSEDEQIGIAIVDNGQGISEDLNEIFKPFYTTKLSGSGLGLSFVARLVQIYGGKIKAANMERGAKFTVMFPK